MVPKGLRLFGAKIFPQKGCVNPLRIAAVVVTYNRKELLARCVACLQNQQGARCEIWVIDNASTDGTAALFAGGGAGVRYCNTGRNLGGAGGFAYGANAAVADGCDAVWLMDDDTLPEPGALAALLQAEKTLDWFGWLSSRALSPQGGDQPMNRQRKTPYRDIAGYQGEAVPAVMASFVSLYLRAATVKEFGLPIAEFFIWSDDWEYTRRISRRMPCYVIPQSRVVHAMKQASVVNIAKDTDDRLARYRYFYRNDVVLYRREGAAGWAWLLLKDCWHSAQVLFGGCSQKKQRLRILWRGFAEGVRFHPAIRLPGAEPPKERAADE